jgi:hypothetical protein
MTYEGGGDRGRSKIEGKECSRLTAHVAMLTGPQAPGVIAARRPVEPVAGP